MALHNDIDLALFRNIPKLNRRGHHYIIGINLGVQQNPHQSIPAVNSVSYGAAVSEEDEDDDDDDGGENGSTSRAVWPDNARASSAGEGAG
ncbi:hypothetical protein DFQ26_003224 [Actinomortierella ambigua]|nr:hypothetical protein DFQ26_003224 [Actinomortierella ambigua]